MTAHRNFGMTSRRAATGISQRVGSRDAPKQYNQRTEIVRMPSGSIAQIPAFEPFNPSHALRDCLVVVGGLLAFVCVFGSLPLAVGLLLFGVF